MSQINDSGELSEAEGPGRPSRGAVPASETVRASQASRRRSRRQDAGLLACVVLLCLASAPSFDASGEPTVRVSEAAAELRWARELHEQGEVAQAAEQLAEVATRHPIIGDHALALRAALLIEAGEASEGAAVLLEALATHDDSPLRAQMFHTLGNARLEAADESGARAAWEAALKAHDRTRNPELLWALAESHEREGQIADAFERYREIWLSFPSDDLAVRADEQLAALEAGKSKRLRTAEDWRRRGDRLFRAHHNAAALASLERSVEMGLTKSGARRAAYRRAHTLFRMRRYDTAVEAFAALPAGAEQRLWHARSLARADRVPEAIEAFESLAGEGHGEIGMRATLYAALLLDGRKFHDRARKHFETLAASRRFPGLADGALWRLAWREFQDGDFDAALPRLERLVEIEKDPIVALRWRYWRARCLESLGRPEAGIEYVKLASYFPFTYYGWRASFRTPADAEPVKAPEPRFSLGKGRLPPRALARARILLSAGYRELARRELRELTGTVRGLAERLELAQLLSDAGDHYAAQRVVVDAHVGDLARGPTPRHEDLWWYAWPAAFGEAVDQATAQPGAAERELVYAIMREESGYRPEVLSFSGAYGLMQIMPTTGERLARDSGRSDFETNHLLEPKTNVALGAWYLGELSARFPTRPSAAIASYNAGPQAVAGWLADDPSRLDDEWVESIPYDQTRRYVKRVLRSLHAYRVLY